jgi:uncharacterized protein
VISVTALSTTPVKGFRLHRVDAIDLGRDGARDNRRFFMIDDRDRMLNAKRLGELQTVVAELDGERLSLCFPGDRVVEAEVELGGEITTHFFSEPLEARVVVGPWAEAMSEHLGEPVRLVQPAGGGVDRRLAGAASLISRASLATLAEAVGESEIDARRFRMLVEVDGIPAHVEDRWVGRGVKIGDAVVRFNGHVGRCLITSRHPETGEIDLPTLDALASYRRGLPTTEPLPFGIYGEVLEAGKVHVGDPVTIVD